MSTTVVLRRVTTEGSPWPLARSCRQHATPSSAGYCARRVRDAMNIRHCPVIMLSKESIGAATPTAPDITVIIGLPAHRPTSPSDTTG